MSSLAQRPEMRASLNRLYQGDPFLADLHFEGLNFAEDVRPSVGLIGGDFLVIHPHRAFAHFAPRLSVRRDELARAEESGCRWSIGEVSFRDFEGRQIG